MNYIWDLIIHAEQLGMIKKDAYFKVAESFSPYMELSNPCINSKEVLSEVEVNPYYRFYEIFKDMFNINNEEDTEFRNTLFDITLHFITEIDRMQGMNKKEFHQRFLRKDIETGLLGISAKEKLALFNETEKRLLTENLLKLYITGESISFLKDTLGKIFRNSFIYANYETMDELIIYIPFERTQMNQEKLALVLDTFLPVKFSTEVYWKDHFGIIEMEETMIIDQIALY